MKVYLEFDYDNIFEREQFQLAIRIQELYTFIYLIEAAIMDVERGYTVKQKEENVYEKVPINTREEAARHLIETWKKYKKHLKIEYRDPQIK